VLLSFAFIKWTLVPVWLGGLTLLLGFSAVALILAIPDNFELYKPLFHVKVIWLVMMGVTLLRQGINLAEAEA
jgi:hypothetical protein